MKQDTLTRLHCSLVESVAIKSLRRLHTRESYQKQELLTLLEQLSKSQAFCRCQCFSTFQFSEFFLFCLSSFCELQPMLPEFLDCQFLIDLSVLSNGYLQRKAEQ
jgi:hypothetical protein